MIPKKKREKCRKLRRQGLSLGRIVKVTKLSKTTVWDQIKDICFSEKARERFESDRKKRVARSNRRRRGKCWPGRIVIKPSNWSPELIYVLSHFLFDGCVKRRYCQYYNTSKMQIELMKERVKNLFGIDTLTKLRKNNVLSIGYHYVELGEYTIKKTKELKRYIKTASLEEKRIFLRSFFDDEGCISIGNDYRKRIVRGYQHSREILKLIQNLLKDFSIEGKINKTNTEICISRRPNLIKFQKEINFSPGIYINPNRKNGIWKTKLEKREILEMAINSYLP